MASEDAILQIVTEAGPRAFTSDVPVNVRLEIAKSSAHGPYREACLELARRQVALIHAEIDRVCQENRHIERTQEFKAGNGLGYPYYRMPVLLRDFFEAIYGEGCWQDGYFVEDVLKHHPGLRLKVTRGTRGQKYAGNGK